MSGSSQFQATALVATGLAINAVYQVRRNRDPFPTIFIGSVWLGLVVIMGTVNSDLAVTVAAVYLLAVVVTRGLETFDFLSELSGGLSKSEARRSQTSNRRKKKGSN